MFVWQKDTYSFLPPLSYTAHWKVTHLICASRSEPHLHHSESRSCILNTRRGLDSDFWSVSLCEMQPVAPACQPPSCSDEGGRGHMMHAKFNFVATERAEDGTFTNPLLSDEWPLLER